MLKCTLLALSCFLHFSIFSQANTKGKVNNEAGEALTGVTLQVLSSTLNAVTDTKDKFLFSNVPAGIHHSKLIIWTMPLK
ncbi:MAG: hypothetical protein AAGG68_25585 [Bacteroidota bacterium]